MKNVCGMGESPLTCYCVTRMTRFSVHLLPLFTALFFSVCGLLLSYVAVFTHVTYISRNSTPACTVVVSFAYCTHCGCAVFVLTYEAVCGTV